MRQLIKLFLALFIITAISRCTANSEVNEYNELFQATDSLEKRNERLMSIYDTLLNGHQELDQDLKTLTNPDTSWMEQLARQKVVFNTHEASFEKHQKIFAAYNNYQNSRDQVSKEEFRAQVSEMEQGHTEIRNQLEQIENQQHTLSEEQATIRQQMEKAKEQEEDE